ncbi:MAG: hypothetical protein AAF491_04000 [Verrucomicrobiota bacterium]
MIQRAADADANQQRFALEEFCRAYWNPLYGYARIQGNSIEDSEDAVQEFLAQLMESPTQKFGPLDSTRGKLRSWLLKAFRNFLITRWKHANREKRGGEIKFVGVDEPENEIASLANQEAAKLAREFDRAWAETVMSRAKEKLKETLDAQGKSDRFQILEPFLTQKTDQASAEAAASELGMSVGATRMALSRMREDYRAAIHLEIRDTIGSDLDVKEEFDYLISCLA